jgi:hypothetical protein
VNELDRWFHRQAAREARIVVLEEALLGGRLRQYAWYRLRYFFATYLVESAAHAVLVLYLFEALAWDNFIVVLVAVAATQLVSHFWWGALESMRAQVRDLHRSGKPHRIPAAVGAWLSFSLIPAAALLVVAVGWVVAYAAGPGIGATEVYVATLLLRLAVDLPVRCYHSGIYAMRRVYKPLSATIAPELIGLATMLALWQVIDIWALVVSSLLVTGVLTVLTVEYTRRVYHFLGFRPLDEVDLPHFHRALAGRWREFSQAGASHAVMALDSLVVLALLYSAETDSESLVVLFLTMPTIRAGADWARLLYFDLKRLELRLFTNLRRRFDRYTALLAWLLGLAFWVVAMVITTAFYGYWVGDLSIALLAFFLARSVLARLQLQAFADGAYASVIWTGALLVAGIAAVSVAADGEAARLGGVAVAAAVCAVVLEQVTRVKRAHGEPGTALLTLEWLGQLGHVRVPVRVASARLVGASGPERLDARSRAERDRWRLEQLAQSAARRLGHRGAAAWIGPDRIVWFEAPAEEERRITSRWLQRASGGLIAGIVTREAASGEEALLAAARADLLGPSSAHLLTPIVPVDEADARRTFAELVPGGIVYSPDEPVPSELAALTGSELRAIMFDAAAFARDLGTGRRQSKYDVTPLCAGGELRLIFVADPHAGRKRRARWRQRVTALNVRASVGGVSTPRLPDTHLWRPALLRGR